MGGIMPTGLCKARGPHHSISKVGKTESGLLCLSLSQAPLNLPMQLPEGKLVESAGPTGSAWGRGRSFSISPTAGFQSWDRWSNVCSGERCSLSVSAPLCRGGASTSIHRTQRSEASWIWRVAKPSDMELEGTGSWKSIFPVCLVDSLGQAKQSHCWAATSPPRLETTPLGNKKLSGMGCRGRREGGPGWGTHVTPWLIHVSVCKNHCNIIK